MKGEIPVEHYPRRWHSWPVILAYYRGEPIYRRSSVYKGMKGCRTELPDDEDVSSAEAPSRVGHINGLDEFLVTRPYSVR